MPEDSGFLLLQTKRLLRQFNLRARKGLGQHFLVDRGALKAAVLAARLHSDDIAVEVGPGLGVLTEELARLVRKVIAIEVDPRITTVLTERLSHLSNVTLVNADVLKLDLKAILGCEPSSTVIDYKVVANLPYFIAVPTIRYFLEAECKPRCMVVMVQKEVAESMVAVSDNMSILSVSVYLYGKPSIVEYVPSHSFYPPPKVDSAIVYIDVYDRLAVEVDTRTFFKTVKAGFSAPRKQLRNALAQGYSIAPAKATEFLVDAGISPRRRAETLSLEEWAELHRVIQRGEGAPSFSED